MKKEEMITTMNKRFSGMNETGVEFIYNIIMAIPQNERWMLETTQERIAELDAITKQKELKAKQAEQEAYQQQLLEKDCVYSEHAKLFDTINSVDIPTRYDLSTDDIMAIDKVCGEISRCFPEYALGVAHNYFNYGFAMGSKCTLAAVKKTTKKGSH